MASAITFQPNPLFGLAAISPVAFQNLSAGRAVASLDSPSSIVQLSLLGQVLAAGATLETALAAQQASPAPATPASAAAGARNFVSAFNALQQTVDDATPFLGTQAASRLVAQLSQTLNGAANATPSTENPNLASLQGIGIGVADGRLTIDQEVLNAAAAADPAATQARLAAASRALLQPLATFEAQASQVGGLPGDTTPAQGDLAAPGVGVPVALLRQLPADSVLNALPLNNLDLQAVGLDAATLGSNGALRDAALNAVAASAASPTSSTSTASTASTAQARPGAVSGLALAAELASLPPVTPSPPPSTVPARPAVLPANGAPPPATPAPAAATPLVDNQADASAASQALQRLVDDPALRAIANNRFNPAYAALMAAAHQSDFISSVISGGRTPVELPTPARPVERVQAIHRKDDPDTAFGQPPPGESSREGTRREFSGRAGQPRAAPTAAG